MKLLVLFSIISYINVNGQLKYPNSKKSTDTLVYFNTKIPNPYHWLENDLSDETDIWIAEQNKITYQYLGKIPYRDAILKRVKELFNYEKISLPFIKGEYTYFYKNSGLQKQSVLYRKNKNDEIEEFINPNKLSEDGSISISTLNFSKNNKYCSYFISNGGSDLKTALVLNTMTKELLEDKIENTKFSDAQWLGEDGFFYSAYSFDSNSSMLTSKNENHKIFYHKVGTSQKEDKFIFGGNTRYISAKISEDEKYLFVYLSNNTHGGFIYYSKIINGQPSQFNPFFLKENTVSYIKAIIGNDVYLYTNYKANNGRLLKIDINNSEESAWEEIIANSNYPMDAKIVGGKIITIHKKDVYDYATLCSITGQRIKEIVMPDFGYLEGFSGEMKDTIVYFSFSNTLTPSIQYQIDLNTGVYKEYYKTQSNFESSNYLTKQVFYYSEDGTKIPMTLNYKKGTILNGKNPTILYGYGGFNNTVNSNFNVFRSFWLENGGIYATANIRGGGEYGDEWYKAGIKMKKKNVFNDFVAAAEYLIANSYTSKNYLAIKGGSNGGLLVGACLTMRPELFSVALPAVGVLDMLQYHKFTAGAGWSYDYGTANDSKEMFEYLHSYSPIHNVKNNTCYPATLITTGDHDDRVVPSHSYKFAAYLQENQNCTNPALLRVKIKGGHGSGASTNMTMKEITDEIAFTLWNMGIINLNNPHE